MNPICRGFKSLGFERNFLKSNVNINNIKLRKLMTITNTTYRKYYEDTHLYEWSSRIIESSIDSKGKYIVFDSTIFHPQGGGQPSDKGTFRIDNQVFTVTGLAEEEEIIKHYYSCENTDVLLNKDVEVFQSIDAESRKLFARLHSAGHLLANAVSKTYPGLNATKGNHFPGQSFVLIEASNQIAMPSREEFKEKIFKLVNEYVTGKFFTINNWSEPGSRTIGFGDLPVYPCGGTHVKETSEIGEIKFRSFKNEKGNLKVGYDVI